MSWSNSCGNNSCNSEPIREVLVPFCRSEAKKVRMKALLTCVTRLPASSERTPVGMLSRIVAICRRRCSRAMFASAMCRAVALMATTLEFFSHSIKRMDKIADLVGGTDLDPVIGGSSGNFPTRARSVARFPRWCNTASCTRPRTLIRRGSARTQSRRSRRPSIVRVSWSTTPMRPGGRSAIRRGADTTDSW